VRSLVGICFALVDSLLARTRESPLGLAFGLVIAFRFRDQCIAVMVNQFTRSLPTSCRLGVLRKRLTQVSVARAPGRSVTATDAAQPSPISARRQSNDMQTTTPKEITVAASTVSMAGMRSRSWRDHVPYLA
jgi:hypothetical protein